MNAKVKEIQYEERVAMKEVLRKYGTSTEDGGYEYIFFEEDEDNFSEEDEDNRDNAPIIAAYGRDGRPHDFRIQSVSLDDKGHLKLKGEDVENGWEIEDIDVEGDDVFAGQLTYVVDDIEYKKTNEAKTNRVS